MLGVEAVVEEDDAVVVEVESDCRLWVGEQALPRLTGEPVAVDAFGDDHPLRRHHGELELMQGFVGDEKEVGRRFADPSGSWHGGLHVGLFDGTVPQHRDGLGMNVVRQPEEQAPALHGVSPKGADPPGMEAVEVGVGIIRGALINNALQEVEGKGRMYAISATVAKTNNPNPRFAY